MIAFVILLALIWSFYIGYARGILLQLFYTFVCLIAMVVAMNHYQKFGNFLALWVPFANAGEGASTYYFEASQIFSLDLVFYAGLAFFLIYLMVYVLGRFAGIFLHPFVGLIPDRLTTNLISGCLAVAVTWVSIQMFLTIFTTVPLSLVQETLHSSKLANVMIEQTPIMTNFFRNLWVTKILG